LRLMHTGSCWKIIIFGLFCGLSLYIFPVTLLVIYPCMGALILCNTTLAHEIQGWIAGKMNRTKILILFMLTVATLSGSPAAYHYLTRQNNYVMPTWALLCWLNTFLFGLTAVVLLNFKIKIPWRALAPYVFALLLTVALPKIPQYFFQIQYASLPPTEQKMYWRGNVRDLEHLHNWPTRIHVTLAEILPQVIGGYHLLPPDTSYLEGYVTSCNARWYYSAIGLVILAAMIVGCIRGCINPITRIPAGILIFCVLGIITLYFISYCSANYYSFRYLAPFAGGLYLLANCAFKDGLHGKIIMGLIAYVGLMDLILLFFNRPNLVL